jgi:hypothetical protein
MMIIRRLMTAVLVILAIHTDAFSASQLKQLCEARCQVNFIMLCESTTGSTGASPSSSSSCTGNCLDAYSSCDSACGAGDSTCVAGCNSQLSSCSSGCSDGSGQCKDKYSTCRRGCLRMTECSQNAHCSLGQVCQKTPVAKCVSKCVSNAKCRQQLGPGALCMTTGSMAGLCVLS